MWTKIYRLIDQLLDQPSYSSFFGVIKYKYYNTPPKSNYLQPYTKQQNLGLVQNESICRQQFKCKIIYIHFETKRKHCVTENVNFVHFLLFLKYLQTPSSKLSSRVWMCV